MAGNSRDITVTGEIVANILKQELSYWGVTYDGELSIKEPKLVVENPELQEEMLSKIQLKFNKPHYSLSKQIKRAFFNAGPMDVKECYLKFKQLRNFPDKFLCLKFDDFNYDGMYFGSQQRNDKGKRCGFF